MNTQQRVTLMIPVVSLAIAALGLPALGRILSPRELNNDLFKGETCARLGVIYRFDPADCIPRLNNTLEHTTGGRQPTNRMIPGEWRDVEEDEWVAETFAEEMALPGPDGKALIRPDQVNPLSWDTERIMSEVGMLHRGSKE